MNVTIYTMNVNLFKFMLWVVVKDQGQLEQFAIHFPVPTPYPLISISPLSTSIYIRKIHWFMSKYLITAFQIISIVSYGFYLMKIMQYNVIIPEILFETPLPVLVITQAVCYLTIMVPR